MYLPKMGHITAFYSICLPFIFFQIIKSQLKYVFCSRVTKGNLGVMVAICFPKNSLAAKDVLNRLWNIRIYKVIPFINRRKLHSSHFLFLY